MIPDKWHFWIDRGGTFTDIVARCPDGRLVTHKLLSESRHYRNSSIQGIREVLNLTPNQPLPNTIAEVRMGTTFGTNALLTRNGSQVALLITQGFGDALRIGYQNRPELFALNIVLPEMLYEHVIEVEERYSAQGEELIPLNLGNLRTHLQKVYDAGIRGVAIVFMHGYRYPRHERQAAELAKELGFTQISVSHQVSPLQRIISRGDTTVVDAYLGPVLRDHIQEMAQELGNTRLFLMQSNGGLTDYATFKGCDSVLSSPSAGVVGGVQTAALAGFKNVITFDMGGTSTDVSHFSGEFERTFVTKIAGVRLQTPMMRVHTIAAGGSSVLYFKNLRFQVGPQSAGANPGPACYRQGGPLTITDCHVLLGRLHAQFFPKVFGESGREPLDDEIVKEKFAELTVQINQATGQRRTPIQVAEGFLEIAVDSMANAIKKISVQRGYDVHEYTLCCLGSAAGQHACLVAEALGIRTIFVHPKAGVLSAFGMGLADIRALRERAITADLNEALTAELLATFKELEQEGHAELLKQGIPETFSDVCYRVRLCYAGTNETLLIKFASYLEMKETFALTHRQRYGFSRSDTPLRVESVLVEVISTAQTAEVNSPSNVSRQSLSPIAIVSMVSAEQVHTAPVYLRENLPVGARIIGPALIVEANSTTVVEVSWRAEITPRYDMVLTYAKPAKKVGSHVPATVTTRVDPVVLEIFNNLFISVADQMGATLANTAYSVNIKERLDFSCAVFDQQGLLTANAPHVPVHLGSMSDSVQAVIQECGNSMHTGDVFVLNNPYRGGTHLPDITVITPVFEEAGNQVLFYVASRGHHADVGGITPGSIPPHSHSLHEEGVVIDAFKLVVGNQLQEQKLKALLCSGKYPVRNFTQNLADLRAQIAANATGVRELQKMVHHFGLDVVHAYMRHVQDNAELAVRQLLNHLKGGEFCYELDSGDIIRVRISVNNQLGQATVDFSGTSAQQQAGNFNTPASICKAAVLYVFRTLVQDAIPLNAGCLKPIQVLIPSGCLLNPTYPAAVVAGNIETSQCVTDALYGALGVMAASQGTMNNFTFGNSTYQYYETICGGSGAGPHFHGTSAVHTHMTNSRLTDPEVLEWNFPVLLESFSIRQGSGGNGQFRGGDGVIRRLRFRETMTASIVSSHRRVPPYGMAGGEPGKTGRNWVERVDGHLEELPGTATVEVQAGDVFGIATPGGGGYGISRKIIPME